MINSIRRTAQFKKDYKKLKAQGKNMAEIKRVLQHLIEEKALPAKNRDHLLSGKYLDCRECHIKPDWLLIYQVNDGELVLVRTGSHSELFG